tara:strand:+ start:265 stop:486 length:222 start_codon:yes stop_codon:yes gene_type:complete
MAIYYGYAYYGYTYYGRACEAIDDRPSKQHAQHAAAHERDQHHGIDAVAARAPPDAQPLLLRLRDLLEQGREQ